MNDFFKVDANTEETSSNTSNYVLVNSEEDFIQENVFAKEVVLSEDGRFYQIICTKDGKEMTTQRQYFPDRAKVESGQQTEEKFLKASEIKKGLLVNFLRKFLGKEAVIDATGWQDFVNKVQARCSPKYATTPLRVKLELVESNSDGKIYTNIATFGPFELMSEPKKLTVTDKDRAMLAKKEAMVNTTPDNDGAAPGETTETVSW